MPLFLLSLPTMHSGRVSCQHPTSTTRWLISCYRDEQAFASQVQMSVMRLCIAFLFWDDFLTAVSSLYFLSGLFMVDATSDILSCFASLQTTVHVHLQLQWHARALLSNSAQCLLDSSSCSNCLLDYFSASLCPPVVQSVWQLNVSVALPNSLCRIQKNTTVAHP